jgi:hypothetical protein
MFCFAALADSTTGTMYTDLTSAFPVRSFKNMIYIFVAYIYDLNAIIVCPMATRTDASFIAAFTKVFTILYARDYQPALNIMDNKCSETVEKHIRANRMRIQLVPPHNPCVNAAKRAIGTFNVAVADAVAVTVTVTITVANAVTVAVAFAIAVAPCSGTSVGTQGPFGSDNPLAKHSLAC